MLNMKLITKENHERLSGAYERINAIVDAANEAHIEDLWASAYDAIFGGGHYRTIMECVPDFEWYDPDSSYEEDVRAFRAALDTLMNNLKVV